ncbi:hypothetical protein AB0J20_29725 [Micromonospora costi]|uniref:hypothetical protein n=1 Tax=Micromonospora costi TaxID=1530042 RepID=UPI0033EE43E4
MVSSKVIPAANRIGNVSCTERQGRRLPSLSGLSGHTWVVVRHEFGAAVRQLRENTAPATVGLPVGRRRVRGLRREELGERERRRRAVELAPTYRSEFL